MKAATRESAQDFYYQFEQLDKELALLPGQLGEPRAKAFLHTLASCVKRVHKLYRALQLAEQRHQDKQQRDQLNEFVGHLLMRPRFDVPEEKRALWQLGKNSRVVPHVELGARVAPLAHACPFFEGLLRARAQNTKLRALLKRGAQHFKQTQANKTRFEKYAQQSSQLRRALARMHAQYVERHAQHDARVANLYDVHKQRTLNAHKYVHAKKKQKKTSKV